MPITVYDQKRECYGCGACMNICPANALTMVPDEEGFLYPKTEVSLCTGCGLCRTVCPYHQDIPPAVREPEIYAIKHRNEAVRSKSTSGGFFTAISDFILKQGGVVYGAVLGENLKVCHERAQTRQGRNRMCGSKYVQSETGYLYHQVKMDLSGNRRVLFTGTPCQCAGLACYLEGIDTKNLILCDIICHGVPSGLLWKEYKNLVEEKKGRTLKTHQFRTKLNGWHSMTSRNIFLDGSEDFSSCMTQIHMKLFLSNLILRPCCYSCKYATLIHPCDFTMGDFWGIESSLPEFDDNRGISQVIVNTAKGEELFNDIRDRLIIRERDSTGCTQHNLHHPTPCPKNRDTFWQAYRERGYPYVARKYAGYHLIGRLLRGLYLLLKALGLLKYIRRLFRWLRRHIHENSNHNLS